MDDNFEKQIKTSMEDPPRYPFEERLWLDLDDRLNKAAVASTAPRPLARWLPLALLALLPTALAAWFYSVNRSTLDRLTEVERILEERSAVDTIVRREVVVIRDTVYFQAKLQPVLFAVAERGFRLDPRYERTGLNGSFPSGPAGRYLPPHYDQLFAASDFSGGRSRLGIYPVDEPTADPFAGAASGEEALLSSAGRLDAPTFLPGVATPDLYAGRQVVLPWIPLAEKRQRKPLSTYFQPLKPTHFSLATTLGAFTFIDNNANDGRNFTSSLWGEIGYGDRLALVIGLEHYLNAFKWKTEDGHSAEVAGLPILPPDNAGDMLQEIYGAFHYAQIPFGVRYQLLPQKRLHPYLGFGLLSRKATNSNLRIGYLSAQGEYSLSRERILPKTFELSALWSTFGFQLDWTRHWAVLLEGGAQLDIKPVSKNYERSNLLRLNAGLRYQF